ncbi:ATP-binding protein [Candidatus Neptunochlamydia vexilliferae]|uniref:AAA+ ATPase domain-containing protein n=1 Tax=Candidatus Neptunichlamydia vexilliferae TaxID=1651774 RepID=A0ABS0AWV4_9BACT|nr:ATP-binding protein [Candidatus Neptunochlamydia vexilliferae]MBF5058617.1 hypothetical protein [Candidatus Neptunochlamydia vexilliferae]
MEKSFTRRLYRPLIEHHFKEYRQMVFLMGPRQVGKTTLCRTLPGVAESDTVYLNWDNLDHRELILKGPKKIAEAIDLNKARKHPPFLMLDEIHKYSDWKTLLKGFFDTYSHYGEIKIVVTGSARLDVYKTGGDSLMGRYLRYRVHPFSCGELITSSPFEGKIRPPSKLNDDEFNALFTFGGFPEPLFKGEMDFYRGWSQLRLQQLFYEDVRDLTNVQEIKQMELLGAIISQQTGSLCSYTSLSKKVRVSIETIRRWLNTLRLMYYCFTIQPWSKNITRSLLKDPKAYLWDWSLVPDKGARAENFIASHLLKTCHYWTDKGEGDFGLYFLRDKEKREVDFLVTKNDIPWFLVEVKQSKQSLSPDLTYFFKMTGAKHAFQVVMDAPYEEVDCFSYDRPIVVSAKTFLSQLV